MFPGLHALRREFYKYEPDFNEIPIAAMLGIGPQLIGSWACYETGWIQSDHRLSALMSRENYAETKGLERYHQR